MKKHILIALLLAAGSTAVAQNKFKAVENNLGGWVKIRDSIGWNIRDRMANYHINAVSIAVIDHYKIAWAKAYGWADTAKKIPATTNTLFQAASVGKSIHATAMMKLAQDGKINLDSDINTYLKSWRFPYDTVSHGKKITVREILSHTAGLSVHGYDGYLPGQHLPSILQIINGEPPANSPAVRSIAEPGKKFEYSGGGYEISELITEDITGKPYTAFMRSTIFKPMQMNRTFYQTELTRIKDQRLATAYRYDGKSIGCDYHIYPENACGAGLWTTPTDLAKFIIQLQLSINNKSNKILAASSTQQLFNPQVEKTNALGFFVEQKGEQTYFHHDGVNEGFVSDYFASLKNGQGVVIMANTDLATYIDITEEITNSVATVYGWNGFYTPVVKTEVKVPDSLANAYCGKYRFNENSDQTVTIFKKNDKLWFHDSSSPVPWLMHFSNYKDFFFYEIVFNMHSFTMNKSGKIDGFMIKAPDGSFKVKRIE